MKRCRSYCLVLALAIIPSLTPVWGVSQHPDAEGARQASGTMPMQRPVASLETEGDRRSRHLAIRSADAPLQFERLTMHVGDQDT